MGVNICCLLMLRFGLSPAAFLVDGNALRQPSKKQCSAETILSCFVPWSELSGFRPLPFCFHLPNVSLENGESETK